MSRVGSKVPPARQRRPVKRRRSSTRSRWALALTLVAAVIVGGLIALRLLGQASPSPSNTSAQAPASAGSNGGAGAEPTVGSVAPDGTFRTVTGDQLAVSSLRGHPALLWFVSTWCSSCQAGTQAMASEINTFRNAGVRVVELELYNDLGQAGPGIDSFARTYAGNAITNPDWTFGQASQTLTQTYDAQSYLDIYYLLDSMGRIVYINGSPGESMPQLLSQIHKVAHE